MKTISDSWKHDQLTETKENESEISDLDESAELNTMWRAVK